MNNAVIDQPLDLREARDAKLTDRANRHDKPDGYFDLLAFIFSNAVAGEIMAVENYSEMVPLMANTEAKIEAVKQAYEESKHIRMLSSLGRRFDFGVMQEIVEPQWFNIRRHFSTAAQKKDLAACLIIQDLMTESMAIVLYRTLARDTDPDTITLVSSILNDEEEHLQIGVDRIHRLLNEDPDGVHESLEWAHNRVMPELFSMMSTSCHSLCDRLSIECGSLSLSNMKTDIDAIRVEALDVYIETLDRAGFDPKVTAPLIAKMQNYGGMTYTPGETANA